MKTTRTLSLALALLLPALASAALNEGVMTYSGYLRTCGSPRDHGADPDLQAP